MSRSAPSRIDIVLVEVVNMNSELLRQFVGGCIDVLFLGPWGDDIRVRQVNFKRGNNWEAGSIGGILEVTMGSTLSHRQNTSGRVLLNFHQSKSVVRLHMPWIATTLTGFGFFRGTFDAFSNTLTDSLRLELPGEAQYSAIALRGYLKHQCNMETSDR
ncbi:hypothetical protein KCU85_g324, partial [Aureobasidium melanogenum]